MHNKGLYTGNMQSAYAIFKVVESKLAKSEITRTQNQSRKLYF